MNTPSTTSVTPTALIEARNDSPGLRPVLSIVAPVFNEVETLPRFYERVVAVMESLGEPFELILVDDGSTDGSSRGLHELFAHDRRLRVITLSRNFGHQIAISAGLDHVRGEAALIIDSDLQDPPELIRQLVERWKDGAEIVYAQRPRRSGETASRSGLQRSSTGSSGASRALASRRTRATSVCCTAKWSTRW
jgi:dolichol-phosphate mannosyltransferase